LESNESFQISFYLTSLGTAKVTPLDWWLHLLLSEDLSAAHHLLPLRHKPLAFLCPIPTCPLSWSCVQPARLIPGTGAAAPEVGGTGRE